MAREGSIYPPSRLSVHMKWGRGGGSSITHPSVSNFVTHDEVICQSP